MLRNIKKNHQSGFTIIEVLIVLAIAGLIMVAVFTAVPALQRSSRNTQRKSSAAQISASISSYVSNNNGVLPANQVALQTALADYKPGFFPSPGNIWFSTLSAANVALLTTATVGGVGTATTVSTESVLFASGVVCNSTNTGATTTGGSSRSYVILYAVETGSTAALQCIGS